MNIYVHCTHHKRNDKFFSDKKKKNSTKQEKRGRGKTRVHPFSGICSRKSLTSIRYSRSHPRLIVNPQFIRIERPVWMLVEFHHKLNLNIFLIIHNMCSVRLSQVTCVWLIYKREREWVWEADIISLHITIQKNLYVINPKKREIENKLMILVFTVTLYFYFINLIFVFGQTQMLFFIMCTLIRYTAVI